MPKVIFFTAIFIGPCSAMLMVLVCCLRLVLHEGHVIYEQAEEYLWALAVLIAIALASTAAATLAVYSGSLMKPIKYYQDAGSINWMA